MQSHGVDQVSFTQGQPISTTTTPVPVPYAWLNQYPMLLGLAGGDYEAAALADVDGERVYAVEGRTNANDSAWGPTNAASRFFRVGVEMP